MSDHFDNVGSKHTPGPWKVVYSEDDMPWGVVRCESAGAYRHMRVRCEGFGMGEAAANTRLVSAAPELLEALEQLVEQLADGDFDGFPFYYYIGKEGFDMAIAAIKKARGE